MKNTKRKGFTIVELVIVIAVIAILAAVLIPTFASLVKKANVSADEQAVKQMNTALAIYTAENGKPETVAQVKTALDKNLINAESLVPVTQGYAFYWNPTDNEIVLVGKDGKITKPGDAWLLLSTTGFGTSISVSTLENLMKAINDSSNAEPALITLTADVTVEVADGAVSGLEIADDKVVVIDLNDKTLSGEVGKDPNAIFEVNGGTLTLKNGKIKSSGRVVKNNSGDVLLQNVNMQITEKNDAENGAALLVDGISNTTIVGGTFETVDGYVISANSAKGESDGSRVNISGGATLKAGFAAIYIGIYADITIENSKLEGEAFGAFFRGCNVTIRNSVIYNSDEKYGKNDDEDEWKPSCSGPAADVVFACGGTGSGYITTGNYTCENVTFGENGEAPQIFVHEPEGGKVTVTGVNNITHTCHKAMGEQCDRNCN